MILLIFILFQLGGKTEGNTYYNIPPEFFPSFLKIKNTPQYISTTRAYSVPEDYRVKKGDILGIVFYGSFNQSYYQQVTNTGEIWIITSPTSSEKFVGPNLGFFKVEGKGLKEIEEMINKSLKEKYEETTVKVFLIEIGDSEVHIVGNVKKAGSYIVKGLERVYDLIQRAEPKSSVNKVILKRNNKTDTLNINKYLKEGDLSQNPYVQNNDIIIIPWNSK